MVAETQEQVADILEVSDGEEDTAMLGAVSISRGEKKARKAMAKLGLKSQPGFTRVTLRKQRNILVVIDSPDVYKSQVSDS